MTGKQYKHVRRVVAVMFAAVVVPLGAAAQNTGPLKSIIDSFAEIIGTSVIALLSGAALATFMWGLIRLIGAQGDANKRQEAKKWLVWGIIGMFVLVGLWGIVGFVSSTFGIGLGGQANPPGIYIQD